MEEAASALTERVAASFENAENSRTKFIVQAMTKHLHEFVKEVKPTEVEWMNAIQFLTGVGKKCTESRQEFILLSDVMGVSSLVDIISNGSDDARATEPTVLGPFHINVHDVLDNGSSIVKRQLDSSVPCKVHGRVTDVDGNPIEGAIIDVWQTDSNGLYDIQEEGREDGDPEIHGNLRGKFRSNAAGEYWFHTVRPVSYQVPSDGPVGQLLHVTGRSPWRAAHIHARVSAPGFRALTTHIFDSKCPYLATDAVFGMKESLVKDFVEQGDESVVVLFDFVLVASADSSL